MHMETLETIAGPHMSIDEVNTLNVTWMVKNRKDVLGQREAKASPLLPLYELRFQRRWPAYLIGGDSKARANIPSWINHWDAHPNASE